MSDRIDAAAFASLCAPVPAADFVSLLLRTGFSAEAYRDAYGDLTPLDWNATQALAHFLQHGLDERRDAPLTLNRQALVTLARLVPRDSAFKAKLLTRLARHLFDNTAHPYGPAIAERWPDIRALARAGARPYFVAGDSHSNQYALTGTRDAAWLLPIHLLCTAGSARGLANPASRSGYGKHLRQAVEIIRTLPGGDELPFLLQFGQVDIEFVYHFRRVTDGQRTLSLDDYRAFCDTTLERYIGFVTEMFNPPQRLNVFLVSVFPPAVSDAAWRAGYVNDDIARHEEVMLPAAELPAGIRAPEIADLATGIRALEIADLRQRTGMHAHYNAGLRAACRRHGFRFIDGFTPFLGPDGLLDPRYVIPERGGAEHHLDSRATYGAIAGMIWTCIDAMGPAPMLRSGQSPQSPP
ncbi:MAG TPA: hypothetical protein VK741_29845 [Acetobacteraceae bacterium]|jgi:hypothetical protein|nr:hypothetical protein [Acetobacteraceae bacterium]